MKLTPREAEVLELLAAGHKPKKVASLLGIDRASVITRLFTARERLGARTGFQAVAMFAVEKLRSEI